MSAKQQSVFKALADPMRRAILLRLQHGSQTAGEIAAEAQDPSDDSLEES